MGISALKRFLAERRVSIVGAKEKSELRELAISAHRSEAQAKAAASAKKPAKTAAAAPVAVDYGITTHRRKWSGPGGQLCDSQLASLDKLLQAHAIGADACIVGSRGGGKSALLRRLASLLGYALHVVFCHAEMPAHELLQRRATDPAGNTVWFDSPLLVALTTGGIAVLDGIHRLPAGTLPGVLSQLLAERACLSLPDGSRLLSAPHFDALLANGARAAELASRGVRRAHPAVRVLATAEPPSAALPWLSDEMLALFRYVVLPEVTADEMRQVLALPRPPPKALLCLLGYRDRVAHAALAEPALRGALLSLRQLLRARAYVALRPEDVTGALRRATSASMLTIPPAARETARQLLLAAAAAHGLPSAAVPPLPSGADDGVASGGGMPTAAQVEASRRKLKEVEDAAISLRMQTEYGHGFADPQLVARVDGEAKRMADERRAKAEAKLERAGAAAASAATGGGAGGALSIELEPSTLRIGDVSVPRRVPTDASLVPCPHFVPIAEHVRLLREMMLDWSLGQHLLLLGVQGVGKNKLADELLHLMRAEREYIQLHRDTTIAALTLHPVLEAGKVRWEDSALVRAARTGRVLVVDEADKAPLEAVCVLKALAEDGELTLGDGRRLLSPQRASALGLAADGTIDGAGGEVVVDGAGSEVVIMSPSFRLLVLANPPGWPFQGNDFFRECGDIFAAHAVANPDALSQAQLLHKVAPKLTSEQLGTLLSLFAQLRLLHAQGTIAYPYSVRELVLVAKRVDAFPADGLQGALADVFDVDAEDAPTARLLARLLASHGLQQLAEAVEHGRALGDLSLKLEGGGDEAMVEKHKASGKGPAAMPNQPKHGNWDGKQHVGGNQWAGGTGGSGTAGLGGRGGPYRLDVGQAIHMLSEAQKAEVGQEALDAAKKMADAAYAERLEELEMSPHDAKEYDAYADAVAAQVARLRMVLREHETRTLERVWLKGRPQGELDEARLVDGLTGASAIYKTRGPKPLGASGARRRVAMRFVMDLSGSMYTFERLDGRKTRLLEVALCIMQALDGLEDEFEYSMVGHSGTGPEAEQLIRWGEAPQGAKARLKLLQRMAAHTQFCHPGDHTYEASALAIKDVAARPADERFVFVISDADLKRYGKTPQEWNAILTAQPSVGACALLIASNELEAETIRTALAPGRGYVCTDTAQLAATFERILQSAAARQ